MAPHATFDNDSALKITRLPAPGKPPFSRSPPRLVIIGAGSRGTAFGKAIRDSSNGICVGVVEPVTLKRKQFGRKYIWGDGVSSPGQEFESWEDFLAWELSRKRKAALGETVPERCDGVFICVQDQMHKAVILGLAPLGLHIMCEKPLATNLDDCVQIYKALLPSPPVAAQTRLFSIGHVLRYSPHNMLLRKLLLEDKVIGDIMSVNHTEPVGWWHFAHSFVRSVSLHILKRDSPNELRGDWRKESTSAPSLLTKSCHDIDILLWLLCSPSKSPELMEPTKITSAGGLQYFHRGRKPAAAGRATNCLSCNFEASCKFSAKRIYLGSQDPGLGFGNTEWPVDVLVPDIEDCISIGGIKSGEAAILLKLSEDYEEEAAPASIAKQNWYGRCIYESDNDVCDNQTVTMTFNSPVNANGENGVGTKIATFNMVALTQKICERYTNISGTEGEIYADSTSISVHDFNTGKTETHYPHVAEGGHGAGDGGLARHFVLAIDRAKNHGERVSDAQVEHIGCSIEEVVRSHAVVFAAEEARKTQTVVDFPAWWDREVEARLGT